MYICICVSLSLYTTIYIYIYTYMCVYIYIYTHIHTWIYVYVYVCVYISLSLYAYIYIYIYIHIYTYLYKHFYMYMNVCPMVVLLIGILEVCAESLADSEMRLHSKRVDEETCSQNWVSEDWHNFGDYTSSIYSTPRLKTTPSISRSILSAYQ